LTKQPLLFLGRDIAGVPICLYALISFGPVGLVAGLAGGVLCAALFRWVPAQWTTGWYLLNGSLGAALGATVPLSLRRAWEVEAAGDWRLFGTAALAGATCAVVLAALVWRRRAPDPVATGR
jgi:hypothetical protein